MAQGTPGSSSSHRLRAAVLLPLLVLVLSVPAVLWLGSAGRTSAPTTRTLEPGTRTSTSEMTAPDRVAAVERMLQSMEFHTGT